MPAIDHCLDADQVRALFADELPLERIEPVLAHLEKCSRCADMIARQGAGETPLPRVAVLDSLTEGAESSVVNGILEGLGQRLGWVEPTSASHEITPPGMRVADDSFAFLSPAQSADEMGRLGRFRILRVLGTGGMGVVFLAEDTELRRRVALKVMRPELSASREYRERFLREARSAATIEHDHIVTVYHVDVDGGVPMLAMQLLQGETLEDCLRREKTLPPAELARVGREIAEALAAAHGQGLIHRDIKPANVWLEGDRRRVKVLDFGLARPLADGGQLTRSGAIVGTPAYMAPEQAEGAGVDARADLFSLGALLYRAATGEPPFRGANPMAVLRSLANDTPPPAHATNPAVPQALSELIQRLLSKTIADRPSSAAQVARELGLVEAAPPGGVKAGWMAAGGSRRRWLVAASLAFVSFLGAVVAGVMVQNRDGVLVVTVPEDGVRLAVGDEQKALGKARSWEIRLAPGDYTLVATLGKARASLPFAIRKGATTTVPVTFPPPPPGDDPLGRMSPDTIPAAERLPGLPTEVVAVLGSHAYRYNPSYTWFAECNTIDFFFASDGKALIGVDRFGAKNLDHGGNPNGDIVRTYDVATGRELRRFTLKKAQWLTHLPEIKAVGLVAGGPGEWTWKLWDRDTGAERLTVRSDSTFPVAFAASPDGKWLLTAGTNDSPRLWDAKTGKQAAVLSLPADLRGQTPGATFSADSTQIVLTYSGHDGKVDASSLHIFDVATRKVVASESFPGIGLGFHPHEAVARPSRLTADGKAVVLLTREKNAEHYLRVWDLAEAKWQGVKLARTGLGGVSALSPDGTRAVIDGAVYDTDGWKKRTALGEPPLAGPYAFSPDGKRVAGTRPAGEVAIHDVQTGKRLTPEPDLVELMAVSPDGRMLALSDPRSGDGNGPDALRLVDTLTGKVRHHLTLAPNVTFTTAAFAAGGKSLFTGLASGRVGFWNTDDGESLAKLFQGNSRLELLAVSADRTRVATGGMYHSQVKVWDPANRKEVATITLDADGKLTSSGLALSGDGSLLAVATPKGCTVYEVKGGKKRFTVPVGVPFALSPDGTRLVFGESVYDGNGKEVAKLAAPPSGWSIGLVALAFAPDGKTLFGTDQCGRLVRWSLADGSIVKQWQLSGPVKRIALTDDGRYLFSSNLNGTVYAFRLGSGK